MTEKEKNEIEKFVKDNSYNEELKDMYLRELLDQEKKYD